MALLRRPLGRRSIAESLVAAALLWRCWSSVCRRTSETDGALHCVHCPKSLPTMFVESGGGQERARASVRAASAWRCAACGRPGEAAEGTTISKGGGNS
eukprot:1758435-Pyramimonas_sp.AAC.1